MKHPMQRPVPAGMRRNRCCVLVVGVTLILAAGACRSHAAAPRYVVTAEAIDVGVGADLCVAVDPFDTQGVYWWEPRGRGCAKRSTGPGVFHADAARVAQRAPSGSIALAFRVGVHSLERPFVDVQLTLKDDELVDASTGDRVRMLTRANLIVPE